MRSIRGRSSHPGGARSSPGQIAPALAPEANPHHFNPLKSLLASGRRLIQGLSRTGRLQKPKDNALSTLRDPTLPTIPDHLQEGTVNSEQAFVVVENQESPGSTTRQDIVVQTTPPLEQGGSSTGLVASVPGGHTDSSMQSIDYFDATDLQPFIKFNKTAAELANVQLRAKAALNGLSWASQTIIKQENRDRSIHKLLRKMREIYELMIKEGELGKILLMPDILASLSEQIVECAKFVATFSSLTSIWGRLEKDALFEADVAVQRYINSLDLLVAMLQDGTSQGMVTDIYHVLQDLRHESHFNAIPRATNAVPDSTKTCLNGTRSEILKEIVDWAYSEDDAERVYWLSGDEGTGKSTIVHTVAKWFKESGRLGSFFCFDVNRQADCHPGKLLTTMIRDLADFDPSLRQTVGDAVSMDFSFLTATDILLQWRALIQEPLRKSSLCTGPVFLVIDALDECRPDSSREPILRILVDEVTRLPPCVRVLVTSRPTNDVYLALQGKPYIHTASLDDIPREYIDRDIQLYVTHRLHTLRDDQRGLLTSKADGLFEWARVACDFILPADQLGSAPPSEDLLERILSLPDAGPRSPLDEIYILILKSAIQESHQACYQFSSVMRQVLGTLEPLPISSLNEMRRYFSAPQDHFDVEPILESIAPLVSGVTNPTSPVQIIHGSFHDFLTDYARSEEFFVDIIGIQQELARSSMGSMKHGLRFNICGLESSYIRNSDISGLTQRIRERISPHLSYSCRFWVTHIHDATFETHLANELCTFFKNERLLFWLEILSLLGDMNEIHMKLTSASKFISDRAEYADTLSIIRDAQKFVKMFGNAITESTPHLYLSALPFSPEQSVLARLFTPNIRRAPDIIMGRDTEWPSPQLTLLGHADWVRSVAISRDGRRVVSGADDSTIRMWDVGTGLEIGSALEHSGFVMSVAISSDSKIIVSGSSDTTIRVWDAQTGLRVTSPLRGHTGSVNSVAFCPDGPWFASGSSDATIRIWDIKAYAQVATLEGHPKPINSIAVSLNRERIVSGSTDGTIRVWNTMTWSQVGDPINDSASSINSVAFSPDGKLIASGSDDSIIRLWNFRTGSLVRALEGHIDSVTSVAFSADSKYIVSGASDRTVRVWDAVTHSQIGNPLSEHHGKVSSVAISHDSRVVVSASWDGSIRTWDTTLSPTLGQQTSPVLSVALSPVTKQFFLGSFDATIKVYDAVTGMQVSLPLKGHSSAVTSVALSLDGTKIASGSSDRTIRIWDVESRTEVAGPLRGHTSRVNSAAFSPDGKWVVSGSDDNTIRVWDVTTSHATILKEHSDAVNSIVFSLDGRHFVSGSADRTIRVWSAVTWSVVGTPLVGHTQPIHSVALSPDGHKIASGSSDNTIRLWGVQTASAICTLEDCGSAARSVTFSLDNRYVVSGLEDGSVRVHDVQTGSQLGVPLDGHTSPIRSITLDAERIVSGSEDGVVRVWDLRAVLWRDDLPNGSSTPASPTTAGPLTSYKGKEILRPHVRFSPLAHHALHEPPLVDGITDKTDAVRLGRDGWVEAIGVRRHLLFWVPTHWRNTLWYHPPASVMVIPRGVELDLSKMAHGSSWEECWVERAATI